ncbi:MAG TPA: serine protease [Streptosporangiaceae bacterium]|jgi:S1-C subfamily serine protease
MRWLVAGVLGTSLVLTAVLAPQAARAADGTGSMSAALLADEVAPAVQLVQVEYKATVQIPHFDANVSAVNAAQAQIRREEADGEIANSLQSINDQWATTIAGNVDKYYHPASPITTINTTLYATCTGWFATPTGYVVTAAHCVAEAAAAPDILSAVAGSYQPGTTKTLLTHWHNGGVPIDSTISSELGQAVTAWYDNHAKVTSFAPAATVAVPVGGPDGQPKYKVVPATIVASGTPYPGQDYALLKVNGLPSMPSLALDSTAGLSVGDNLYIDGFPGTVTSDSSFTAGSRLQPTFTDGLLSAFRTTTNNVPYLQTQAPAYHGNSGGPVLDASGGVVGTLIAGQVDPSTGQTVAGEQFVLSSAILTRLLAAHGVRAVASPVTTDYVMAMRNFDQGYYTLAESQFRQVLNIDPLHPYANWYAGLAAQQIAAGHNRNPPSASRSSSAGAIVIGLLIVLILLVAAGIVILLATRGRKRRQAAPAWPVQGPPIAPPPPWQQPVPPGPAQPQSAPWDPPPGMQPPRPAAPWERPPSHEAGQQLPRAPWDPPERAETAPPPQQ